MNKEIRPGTRAWRRLKRVQLNAVIRAMGVFQRGIVHSPMPTTLHLIRDVNDALSQLKGLHEEEFWRGLPLGAVPPPPEGETV